MEYCDLTADYPDDAKFRWTCEASWPVREWLRIRPKAQVDKFIRYVKAGQIEVTAMFFNMSELSGENNYKTVLEPVARFRELGLPVETAMQNDVNGIAWCLADYLPDLGVKYFSIGSNNHRALVPFDRPTLYRWESPSGKGMLMFRSDHYHTGNSWGIHTGDMARLEDGVFGYIRNLKRTGYPFPVIAVQYSGYLTDNSPPSMRECDLIRAWNERYAWPKLRSATAHEFLGRIDCVARFQPLDAAALEQIAQQQLTALQQRAERLHVRLELPDGLARSFALRSRDGRGGAREIRRLVRHEMEAPLAALLLGGRVPERVRVDLRDDRPLFPAP